MVSWQRSRWGKGGADLCVCAHSRHLDIKALSVPARGRGGKKEKKLQHISGIFQLMMCGCGSTGEREPLTVLSLFRSPRAPCCIPVHCAYFGNSCSAPFFCFTVYSLCAALALFFPASVSLSLSLSLYLPSSPLLHVLSLSLSFLIPFLGLVQLYCWDCKLSFLQNKGKKEGK